MKDTFSEIQDQKEDSAEGIRNTLIVYFLYIAWYHLHC